MRVFLALKLSNSVIEQLAELSEVVRRTLPEDAIRWVNPGSIHLTLKFLGEVKPSFIDQVAETAAPLAEATPEMHLDIANISVFPNPNRPRVIWVGVQEVSGSLEKLRNNLEEAFEPLGFDREMRSFTPHLTIGRVKRGAGRRDRQAIKAGLAKLSVGDIGSMDSSKLTLYESMLDPGGAKYRSLREFPFKGGSK